MGERFAEQAAVATGDDSGVGLESKCRLESEGAFLCVLVCRELEPPVNVGQLSNGVARDRVEPRVRTDKMPGAPAASHIAPIPEEIRSRTAQLAPLNRLAHSPESFHMAALMASEPARFVAGEKVSVALI